MPFSSETQLVNLGNSVSVPKTCRWCVPPRRQCLLLGISVTNISVTVFCLLALGPTDNLELWLSHCCPKNPCGFFMCEESLSVDQQYWLIHSVSVSFSNTGTHASRSMIFLKDLWQ